MIQIDMVAAVRNEFGKGAARQMRIAGRTPAVLYGPKAETVALSLDTGVFTKELLRVHGQNVVFTLDIDGLNGNSKRSVMVKEIQKNPIRNSLVHMDFFEISLDEPITLAVPLDVVGKSKGEDMGGFLQVATRVVHLTARPLDIPDSIAVDVTALELGGQGITCGALDIPEKCSLREDAATLCVSVVAASREVEETEEGEEETEAVEATTVAAAE